MWSTERSTDEAGTVDEELMIGIGMGYEVVSGTQTRRQVEKYAV
jgi:hypothetical protein